MTVQKKQYHGFLRPLDGLFVCFFLFTGIWFSYSFVSEKGASIKILVNNREVAWYSLNGDSLEFQINTDIGNSTFLRQSGKVRVVNAPCRHKICLKQGWVSHTHEKIICVPGRLLVTIDGPSREKQKLPYDAMSF